MKEKYIEAIDRLMNDVDDLALFDLVYRLFAKANGAA